MVHMERMVVRGLMSEWPEVGPVEIEKGNRDYGKSCPFFWWQG